MGVHDAPRDGFMRKVQRGVQRVFRVCGTMEAARTTQKIESKNAPKNSCLADEKILVFGPGTFWSAFFLNGMGSLADAEAREHLVDHAFVHRLAGDLAEGVERRR